MLSFLPLSGNTPQETGFLQGISTRFDITGTAWPPLSADRASNQRFFIRLILCGCTASALDAASDNPLLQLILEEREEEDQRRCRHDDCRELNQVFAVIRVGGIQEILVLVDELVDH